MATDCWEMPTGIQSRKKIGSQSALFPSLRGILSQLQIVGVFLQLLVVLLQSQRGGNKIWHLKPLLSLWELLRKNSEKRPWCEYYQFLVVLQYKIGHQTLLVSGQVSRWLSERDETSFLSGNSRVSSKLVWKHALYFSKLWTSCFYRLFLELE